MSQSIDEMNRRHRDIALFLQSKVLARLHSMSEEDIEKLSVADLTRLLEAAARIERTSYEPVGAPKKIDLFGLVKDGKKSKTATSESQ